MSETTRAASLRQAVRRRAHLGVTAALFAGTYGLWWWFTASGRVHPIVLPPPDAVWASLVEVVRRDTFAEHLRVTSTEILVGFTAGSATAIGIAFLCDQIDLVRRLLTPYMVALQAVPKIVLIPLLSVWLGVGYRTNTALVFLVVLFPVYLNTLTGLASADADGTRLLTSLGASRRQHILYHRIPSALPLVFSGLKTSVNFAVAAALAAEVLGSRHGVGFLIANSGDFLRVDDLYATVVIATVFAGVFYLFFELIDRKVVFWRQPENRSRQ